MLLGLNCKKIYIQLFTTYSLLFYLQIPMYKTFGMYILNGIQYLSKYRNYVTLSSATVMKQPILQTVRFTELHLNVQIYLAGVISLLNYQFAVGALFRVLRLRLSLVGYTRTRTVPKRYVEIARGIVGLNRFRNNRHIDYSRVTSLVTHFRIGTRLGFLLFLRFSTVTTIISLIIPRYRVFQTYSAYFLSHWYFHPTGGFSNHEL